MKKERETEYGLREYIKKNSYLYYSALKTVKIDFECKNAQWPMSWAIC